VRIVGHQGSHRKGKLARKMAWSKDSLLGPPGTVSCSSLRPAAGAGVPVVSMVREVSAVVGVGGGASMVVGAAGGASMVVGAAGGASMVVGAAGGLAAGVFGAARVVVVAGVGVEVVEGTGFVAGVVVVVGC